MQFYHTYATNQNKLNNIYHGKTYLKDCLYLGWAMEISPANYCFPERQGFLEILKHSLPVLNLFIKVLLFI